MNNLSTKFLLALLLGIFLTASCNRHNDGPPYAPAHIEKQAAPMAMLTTWMGAKGYSPSTHTDLQYTLPEGSEFQWYEKAYGAHDKQLVLLAIDRSGGLHEYPEGSASTPAARKKMDHDYLDLVRSVELYYNQQVHHA